MYLPTYALPDSLFKERKNTFDVFLFKLSTWYDRLVIWTVHVFILKFKLYRIVSIRLIL